jgi:hypothetical protein
MQEKIYISSFSTLNIIFKEFLSTAGKDASPCSIAQRGRREKMD